jgi:Glyoxalase-like domain
MMFRQLMIDANDPGAAGAVLDPTLGYQSAPGDDLAPSLSRPAGDAETFDRLSIWPGWAAPLWFQRVPETKTGKNQLHLDLYLRAATRDRRGEGHRAHRAGGERAARGDDPYNPVYYVVMTTLGQRFLRQLSPTSATTRG